MPHVVLDASTPKDSIIIKYLVEELEKRNVEYKIVARESTQTTHLLEMFGLDYELTGGYGYTIEEKYYATLEQEQRLAKLFTRERPSAVWSHGNVAVVRTAYQLGIPVILSNDTPHNTPVVKLTTALATKLFTPEAIAKCKWVEAGISPDKVRSYIGCEEYTWTRFYMHVDREETLDKYLGFIPEKVVVFRGVEHRASYSYGVETPVREIVERISRFAHVVVIPRYGDEKKILDGIDNLTVLEKTPLAVELLASADIAVLSGGTMAKEAGLLGVPTVSFYFRDDVLVYLMGRGMPIRYIPYPDMIEDYVAMVMEDPSRFRVDTRRLTIDFEDHVTLVAEELEKYV